MIKIKKNPNGDTRTAKYAVSFSEFQEANDLHIADVKNAMQLLGEQIIERGKLHDNTKKSAEVMFHKQFKDARQNGKDFTESEWYQMHIRAERHHLLSHFHEDTNIVDIIEMICDCVCAGLARSGEVRPLEIDLPLLKTAVDNTVEYLKKYITLEE